MNKGTTVRTAIWIALVLASATGLGYGIRQLRWSLASRTSVPESKPPVQVVQREPEVETLPEPELEVAVAQTDPTAGEEPIWEDRKDEWQPEVVAGPELRPVNEDSGPTQQNLGDWRNAWADLNLTQEEQARLREAWRFAVERWQSMSQEQRQAQIARWRTDWERWQVMSDEERTAVSSRNRERLE